MRQLRVVVAILLAAASVLILVPTQSGVSASDPVSPGPPTCPANGQPGDIGCPIDYGASIGGSGGFSPGQTITFNRSLPVGPCANAESTNCYNRFSNPTIVGCYQMDGPTSSDFERCHPFVDNEVLEPGYWTRPGVPFGALACSAQFNEAFYAGGTTTATFAELAPAALPCSIEMSPTYRGVPRLDGPTWLAWSFTYDVCEVAGEREVGNGFGCLQSRQEGAVTWIRLDMPQRVFPVASCEASVELGEPARITVTDTSTIAAGETMETSFAFGAGQQSTDSSFVFTADYPGTVPISVKAEAPVSYSESSARCDVLLPYPQLRGDVTVTEVGPNPSGPGSEYDVRATIDIGTFGYRDIILTRPAVVGFPSGGGQVLVAATPITTDRRLGWGDEPIEITARVRTDSDALTFISFGQSGEHENGRIAQDVSIQIPLGGSSLRILDTPDDGNTIDGLFEAIGKRAADSTTPVQVRDRIEGGDDATAAFFTMSVIDATAAGTAILRPCDRTSRFGIEFAFDVGSSSSLTRALLMAPSGEVCLDTDVEADFAIDFNGWFDSSSTSPPVPTDPQPADPSSGLSPVTPARLADTRADGETTDGQVEGVGRIASGGTLRVPVRGRGGVSASATAVVVNAVVVSPSAPGFLTLYPCDEDRPSTSNVNYQNRPVEVNNSVVKLSADGALCVFSRSEVDVVLDVTAFAEGDEALAPKRLAESRAGERTDDGQQAGFGRVAAGSVTEIEVAGRGGVPADAAAVAVNATAVFPAAPGFLTLFPCDEEMPNASNLNYFPGDVRPNAAVVALSSNGSLCVFSLAETDLIVDVTASFDDVPSFSALNPARLLETRRGAQTIDGLSEGSGRLAPGSTTKVQVAGRGGVPVGASAAAVNAAAVFPSAPGFVTFFPCDEDMPTASSVNYLPGDVIANSVVVKLAADGSVCVFTLAETDLILDVNAAWAP